jgi:3-oxoacyl-[acyl-carrier protein] reductase
MDLRLKGRTALVTAASTGLGYGCAKALLMEGAEVVIAARDKANLGKALKSLKKETGKTAAGIACDLTDAKDLARLAKETLKWFKALDILVLSTGHPPTHPFSVANDEQWQRGHDLILRPAIELPRAFLPGMKKRKYGRLIFIGSIFGLEPEKSSVIQSTFRTGLNALSKCIASEYAPFGVTSNVICPGYYETPLVDRLAGQYAKQTGKTKKAILDDWKQYSPMGAYGDPDDLGAYAAFLASPRAAFITGASMVLDGGAIRSY